jgi:hypothetical protein
MKNHIKYDLSKYSVKKQRLSHWIRQTQKNKIGDTEKKDSIKVPVK